ncbi:VOC family protein [Paraburkholderia oxyphila]|uniref:VOC family protein n=1 Tax=Paraburkholderia oxyphila TaxID=614212 RepID=UPI000487E61B|nr:VOC family protein [Paraburkholderia oxyphila]
MINLYANDVSRAAAFYTRPGFVESFRMPAAGLPVHVELKLDGFTPGIASARAACAGHGLSPGEGRGMEIVLWTDNTDAALEALAANGAVVLSATHDFLDGTLRAAWVADLDGNPIQLVQRKHGHSGAA